jgi:hypothetical protein
MGVSMSEFVWDLSGTDKHCASYAPGHLIHWIHFNHSMREPSEVIPVTAEVDGDGRVHIEGDDVSLVRWNHRPALVRDALERFGRRAVWKPRWYILAVPEEAFFGGARSVFSLGAPNERRECYGSSNSDHRPPSAASPTGPPVEKVWAEQEAKNAALREFDYSHIPTLRIADRYAGGPARSSHPDGGRRKTEER